MEQWYFRFCLSSSLVVSYQDQRWWKPKKCIYIPTLHFQAGIYSNVRIPLQKQLGAQFSSQPANGPSS